MSKASHTQSFYRSAAQNSICNLTIDDFDSTLIEMYDMPMSQDQYLYVEKQQMKDKKHVFFKVAYYNPELRKYIDLGRFADARVASLTHAIVREHSVSTLKVRHWAAQTYFDPGRRDVPTRF